MYHQGRCRGEPPQNVWASRQAEAQSKTDRQQNPTCINQLFKENPRNETTSRSLCWDSGKCRDISIIKWNQFFYRKITQCMKQHIPSPGWDISIMWSGSPTLLLTIVSSNSTAGSNTRPRSSGLHDTVIWWKLAISAAWDANILHDTNGFKKPIHR